MGRMGEFAERINLYAQIAEFVNVLQRPVAAMDSEV